MANILAKAKADWAKLSQSSVDLDLSFESKNNGELATIKGIGTRHQIQVDTDGLPFNAPNIHISFAESVLALANPLYPIRSVTKVEDIIIKDDLVSFVDNTGTLKLYQIIEIFPDQTVGIIVCMCADYDKTTNPITPISAMSYTNNDEEYDGTSPIATMVATIVGDVDFFKVADSDTADFAVGGLILNRTTGDITGTLIATFSAEVLAIGKDGFTIGAVSVTQALIAAGVFYPTDLDSGLKGFWDASNTDEITDDGNRISQINGLQTGGEDLTQGTGINQPFVGDINGVECAIFSNGNLNGNIAAAIAQPFHVFCFMSNEFSIRGKIIGITQNVDQIQINAGAASLSVELNNVSKVVGFTDAQSKAIANNPFLFEIFLDGAGNMTTRFDGGETFLDTSGGAPTGNLVVNSAFAWGSRAAANPVDNTGKTGFLLIYEGTLSTSDREKIEGWAEHNWRNESALADGHTYKAAPP